MAIFFVIYILAAYQSFALGLRITGTGEKAISDFVPSELVDRIVGKMRNIAILNLLLMSATSH